MDFLKDLVSSFIPEQGNDYKPYFFRIKAVAGIAFVIIILGLGAFSVQKFMVSNNSYLAAVISSVIIDLTNGDRTSNGVGALAINSALDRAAQLKANDMATKGYFAHTSPEGVSPWHWFQEAGYQFSYAGENLAVRFSDSIDVERAWMNSPTHRANLLNGEFTEIGVAVAQGTFEGQPAVFVVQEFGRPAANHQPVLQTAFASTTSTKLAVLGATSVKKKSTTPKAQATSTDTAVLGTSTEQTAPKVIFENESFIAVRNIPAPVAAVTSAETYSTSFAKLFTSPRTLMNTLYLLISLIIVIALILMIVLEIRHQHPRNVVYGFLLLFLMGFLLYAGQMYVGGPLLIV